MAHCPKAIIPLFDATRAFSEQRETLTPPPESLLLKIEDGIAQIEIFGPMLRNQLSWEEAPLIRL
jgi:hypothetical protein